MIKLLAYSFLLIPVTLGQNAYAKPHDPCEGLWSIELVKDENYTPWHAYTQNPSYPIKLEIKTKKPKTPKAPKTPDMAIFTDNKNRECSIGYLNDLDNNLLVFKHCLKHSNPNVIPIHYKISCKGNELAGKIVSFKDLFEIKGSRVEN